METKVADQPLRLVWTKLHAPVRREHVQRTALLEQLTASSARLVLVRAPAGWGKSSLLADWSGWPDERRGFAWLALDRGDDDPPRFLLYVVEALRGLDPEIGRNALPVLLAPGVDLARDALPVLLNELRDLPEAVLVLDDYHVIENPEIHALMEFVLEFGPPALTLAVATRSEPPLPVARARARAQLLELDAAALRFSEPEAEKLLNEMHRLRLDSDTVTRLHERTEGWVAGLFLAALSLRGRQDPGAFVKDFAGDDRHVADYLCAEVLAGQAPETRDFLLRTSILERFCPRLCDAVTGADGGARVLADIERSNLLLVPLDARREWYRYHHLFGELLRDQLALAEPGLSDELHRRAAAWLLQEGLIAEAITHQIAAGQIADAGELIAEHWAPTLLQTAGDRTIEAWLEALGPRAIGADARLCVAACYVGLSTGRMDHVERWLAAAEAAPLPSRFLDGASSRRGSIACVRAAWRWQIGDTGGAMEAGREASETEAGTPWEAIGVACIGLAHVARGEWQDGRRWMAEYSRLGETFGLYLNQASGLSTVAACDAEQGRWDDAARTASHALEIAARHGIDEHWCMAHAHLARGLACERLCDLASAQGDLERSIELADRGAGPVSEAWPRIHLARVLAARGDLEGARDTVTRARAALSEAPDPGVFGERTDRAALALAPRMREIAIGETLSERELAVLRELSGPLSQREIGERLYVSLNTVKSHTRSIFRKLGVSTRETAIARARELGLL